MNIWDGLIDHVADGRPVAVKYLMDWIRRLVRDKPEPVPYIRLYGPQACGKTTFCKAIGLLAKSVDDHWWWTGIWNGPLLDIQVAVLEGPDLRKPTLMARLADFQKPTIVIHRMYQQPVEIENKIRWIECVNDDRDRIPPWNFAFFKLAPLKERVDRTQLLKDLKDELPSFRERLLQ